MYGCSINSHKWAVPAAVWDWATFHRLPETPRETLTPHHALLTSFVINCNFTAVKRDIYTNTGITDHQLLTYLQYPSDGHIIHLMGSPGEILNLNDPNAGAFYYSVHKKHKSKKLAADVAHTRYPATLPVLDNTIQALVSKSAGNHMFVQLFLAQTAFLHKNKFLQLAGHQLPVNGIENAMQPQGKTLMYQQEAALIQMQNIETQGLTPYLWARVQDDIYTQSDLCSLFRGPTVPDATCRGGLLCNDRGTGKTLTAAALIATRPAPLAWLNDVDVATTDTDDDNDDCAPESATESAPSAAMAVDADGQEGATTNQVYTNQVHTNQAHTNQAYTETAADTDHSDFEDDATEAAAPPRRVFVLDEQDKVLRAWQAEVVPRIKTTLVVVPGANLLAQWEAELQLMDLKVGLYYGKLRVTDLHNYDVVLTTLDTLRPLLKMENNLFTRVRFWRLIVDEVHKLLQFNSFTKTGAGLLLIRAYQRWGLTATPDMSGPRFAQYLKFLYGMPSREQAKTGHIYHFMRCRHEYDGLRFPDLRPLCNSIIVKHEPLQNVMPTVRFHEHGIVIQGTEKATYDVMFDRAKAMACRIRGPQTIHLLNALLMGLNGIRPLYINPNALDHVSSDNLLELPPDVYDCCICLEALVRPHRSECHHFFCHSCITRWMAENTTCPLCRSVAMPLRECFPPMVMDANPQAPEEQIVYSAKRDRIIQVIADIVMEDTTARILVFTRFPDMRRCLAESLRDVLTITTNVAQFQENSNIAVLLLSPQTCGVGLNLMQANHVILCEPSFRKSTEEQAYGRAARVGQTRPVHVHRFFVNNTVETKVQSLAADAKVTLRDVFQ